MGSRWPGPIFLPAESDGADGQGDDVVGGHGLFLKEGFTVFGADELAMVAGEQVHAMVELVDGQEYALLALAFGRTELGAVGEDGFAALSVLPGDIHDEGGRHAFKRSGVKNFERAMGLAGEGELFQAGQEATFVAERGGVIVIGVACFPVRKNHGVRLKITDDLRQAQFVLASGLDVGVRDAEVAAPGNAQDFRGERGLFRARFRCAARSHFTSGQIEDACLIALLGHLDQRAAAGEFNVIGMGRDGEYVEFHEEASGESPGL